MLALAFLLPVAVGWGIYEIFSLEDDNSKSANDEYIGTEDPNNFDGRAGNDTLNGLEGKDTLDGGYGNDVIDGGEGSDLLLGGSGHDIVNGGANNDYIFGGFGDDTLDGGSGSDSIFAEVGEDLVDAGDGNDFIDGGNNNDILGGGNGADIILGGNGDDILLGNNNNDDLKGRVGDDILVGGGGADELAGGQGNDTLMGAGYYLGQGGSETGDRSAEFMAALKAAKEDPALIEQYNNLTQKTDNLFIASNYFANVEQSTAGLDEVDGADTLYGGPGDDVLHIASDDVAYGGEGSDEFNVHTSQMLVSASAPVIEFFEPTEDRIVITYDPNAFSGTPPVTYTVSADQVVVNLNGSAVATLPGSYTEAQIASQVSLQQQNPTLVTS